MTAKVGDIIKIIAPFNSFGDYTTGSLGRVTGVTDDGDVDVEWLSHPKGFVRDDDSEDPCEFVLQREYEVASPTFAQL